MSRVFLSRALQWLSNNRNGARRTAKNGRCRRRTYQAGLEPLEDRNLLSTFDVINLNDSGFGSLRRAIEDANGLPGADKIEFARNLNGTIALSSQLIITDDVTIRGPGASKVTVSGDDGISSQVRVFAVIPAELKGNPFVVPTAAQVATSPTVTIEDLAIKDGLAADAPGFDPTNPDTPFALGGGIYNLGGSVHLDRVYMVSNTAQGVVTAGGAVASQYGGTFTASRSHFEDNLSSGLVIAAGGAITADLGVTADEGPTDPPNVSIARSEFIGNKSEAMFGYDVDTPFSGVAVAGAILMETGNLSVDRSYFEGNSVKGGDGAGFDAGGAGLGGAIAITDISPLGFGESTLNVQRSTFVDNTAIGGDGTASGVPGGPASGGAIGVVNDSEAHLSRNHFHANAVTGGNGGENANGGIGTGGAVSGSSGADLTLERNQFTANTAEGGAGAGTGYGASGRGGGLGLETIVLTGFLGDPASARVIHDTYDGNEALGGIGGGLFTDGDLTMARTTLSDNRAIGKPNVLIDFLPGYLLLGNGLGGGLSNLGSVELIDTTLDGNHAVGANGAVGTNVTLIPEDTLPVLPGLGVGGGVHSLSTGTISGGRIIDNVARGGDNNQGTFAGLAGGGGVYSDGGMSVERSLFRNNHAVGGDHNSGDVNAGAGLGGGLVSGSVTAVDPIFGRTGELVVQRSNFRGNEAQGGDNNAGVLPIQLPIAHAPGAGGGGAIFVYQGTAEINTTNITHNRAVGGDDAPGVGGGLYSLSLIVSTDTRLSDSMVAHNSAIGGGDANGIGGGIATGSFGSFFAAGPGSLSVEHSSIFRNVAQGGNEEGDGLGGGIFNDVDALLDLRYSLVFVNQALGGTGGDGIGGGLYNLGEVDLIRARIFANFASTSDDDCFDC